MKEKENLHQKTGKGDVNIVRPSRQKHKIKSACSHARNYNFECDWLIELSDNILSDTNLASELVKSKSFLEQLQSRKLLFLWLTKIWHF